MRRLKNVIVGRAIGQVIDPAFTFNKADVLAQKFVTIAKGRSAPDDQKLGAGAGKSDVHTAPVA